MGQFIEKLEQFHQLKGYDLRNIFHNKRRERAGTHGIAVTIVTSSDNSL